MVDVNIGSANISKIRFAEQPSNPAAPAADFAYIYRKIDGFYVEDENAVVSMLVQAPDAATPQTIIQVGDLTNTIIGDKIGTPQSSNNVLIGDSVAAACDFLSDNVIIGSGAGTLLVDGGNNVAVGSGALAAMVTNSGCVAIGYHALALATTANNIGIGSGALDTLETGTYAIGIGVGVGTSLTTGGSHVLIGRDAGNALTTESGNVMIGHQVGAGQTVANQLWIDNSSTATPLIYGEFDNDLIHINGTLLVKSTTADVLTLGTGTAGIDYQILVDGETNDGTITYDEDNDLFTFNNFVRSDAAVYRRYYHLSMGSFNPGGSGATWVDADANTLSGWGLDAVGETLSTSTDVHSDWDAASDLTVEITFTTNIDNSGGGGGDTVDLQLICYYKGVGETATKTQTIEVATVIGTAAQWTQFNMEFTIDHDLVDHVVQVGDRFSFMLNLETDTSEVDNITINDGSFFYSTTHMGIESGDA